MSVINKYMYISVIYIYIHTYIDVAPNWRQARSIWGSKVCKHTARTVRNPQQPQISACCSPRIA